MLSLLTKRHGGLMPHCIQYQCKQNNAFDTTRIVAAHFHMEQQKHVTVDTTLVRLWTLAYILQLIGGIFCEGFLYQA